MQWEDQQAQRTTPSVSGQTITAGSSNPSHPSYPSVPSPDQRVLPNTPLPIETKIQLGPATRPNTAFGMYALTPPFTDLHTTMQRADEINTIQRMMDDKQTSFVMLIGAPGMVNDNSRSALSPSAIGKKRAPASTEISCLVDYSHLYYPARYYLGHSQQRWGARARDSSC